METINVFEAVRRATDPFGIDGMATAACRPQAKEVLTRLGKLGFVVVPRELTERTCNKMRPFSEIFHLWRFALSIWRNSADEDARLGAWDKRRFHTWGHSIAVARLPRRVRIRLTYYHTSDDLLG